MTTAFHVRQGADMLCGLHAVNTGLGNAGARLATEQEIRAYGDTINLRESSLPGAAGNDSYHCSKDGNFSYEATAQKSEKP